MKYLFAWVAMFAALFAAGLAIVWYVGADIPPIPLLIGAMVIASIFIANDLKRPRPREFNRHTALYPPIPDQYLHDAPISESVTFGTDHHTGKLVQAEQGHHVMICGSTGSGKTATSLIPSILSCKTGSKQIVDIKSRELAYKTADIYNPNTIVIDMNLQSSVNTANVSDNSTNALIIRLSHSGSLIPMSSAYAPIALNIRSTASSPLLIKSLYARDNDSRL